MIKFYPILIMIATFSFGYAAAHSFNVALLISPDALSAAEESQIRRGFNLATQERDGHPNETSNGHLGGLDVYIYTVDLKDDSVAAIQELLNQENIDIMVAVGSEPWLDNVRLLITNTETVLLTRTPLSSTSLESVELEPIKTFIASYSEAYGERPSVYAVLGYNVARRIDAAVRSLAGVGDKSVLEQALMETEKVLDW